MTGTLTSEERNLRMILRIPLDTGAPVRRPWTRLLKVMLLIVTVDLGLPIQMG
jgi:hypothetical protein